MKRTDGFTLVELLLAMAFFSFILTFVVAGFVQINRAYTKGITVRRVQEGARAVMEDLTRAMRTAGSVTNSSATPPYRICFGNTRIGWNQYDGSGLESTETLGGEQINYVKTFDGNTTCDAPFSPTQDNTSPLDELVKLQHLSIRQVGPPELRTYAIKVVTSSVEDSDFDNKGENATCRVQVGDQFCDIATLETVVSLRN